MRTHTISLIAALLAGLIACGTGHAQDETVNYFPNGGFEDGVLEPWYVYGGATAEVVSKLTGAVVPEDPVEGDSCLHVTVPEANPNWWEIGLVPSGAVFEKGKKYTVAAFLKCREGTLQVDLKPQKSEDPWTGYSQETFTITEEWAEYYVTTPVFTENVTPAGVTFHIGFAAGEFWIDGVRFYEGDYVKPVFHSFKARKPNPADGAMLANTWVSLSWEPGIAAASHDVYFGENFDNVEAGTEETFQGNQGAPYFVVGFPGFPYPDGLVYGTTYYWRIDEVNESEPNSPWAGDVWSFTIPPKTAYNPAPADGAKFIQADVTKFEDAEKVMKESLDEFGRIDVLVNNVGWDDFIPFLEIPVDKYDKYIDLNLRHVLYFTRAVLTQMVEQKGGSIVNIGSDAGRVGEFRESVYAAAKGGVISFTKNTAREFGRFQIRANCICPGATMPGSEEETGKFSLFRQEEVQTLFPPEVQETLAKHGYPLRRLGKAEDISNMVVFIASPKASWITGQTISVSGGYSMF